MGSWGDIAGEAIISSIVIGKVGDTCEWYKLGIETINSRGGVYGDD